MTARTDTGVPRGAAPVGRVLDLSPLEMQMVIYLRLWCSGERGQTEVWEDLAARLGPEEARDALRAFESFARTLIAEARRPLQRHGIECPCLGSDEAVFATIAALAVAGERDEAALILALLVPAARALPLADLAEAAGLGLVGSRRPPRSVRPRPNEPTHPPAATGRLM